ncbi:MAG: hypothetical protein HY000_13265 [Planctomycetes bacterium]|nr:hypothetical protein [Planctomycetia bacterium]MBI3464009.1 hypothetical protein [Planctomycetota bacterium]
MFHRNQTLAALVTMLLVLSTAGRARAEDPPQRSGGGPGETPTPLAPRVLSDEDRRFYADVLARLLPVWINPPDLETEHAAVSAMFGGNHVLTQEVIPKQVQQLVIARRLNYRHWESRQDAVNGLAHWFQADRDSFSLIALLREGLDDPNAEVRAQAAAHLDQALIVVETDVYLPKDKAAREDLEKRREDYVDLIVDLSITKGLSDEDPDVQVHARVALESEFAKPTFRRLKCLERALAKNQVHPDVREVAESLRKKWADAVNREEPPWNRPPAEK